MSIKELRENRSRNLSRYYVVNSRKEKIKFFLTEEYKIGNFYSIPNDVIDMENPEDVRKLEFLRKEFLSKMDNEIVIPAGLFDFTKEDERKLLIENIWEKINSGAEVDLSYVPNGLFTDENKAEYELMVLQIIKNKIIKKHKDENGLTADFEISESEISSYRQEFEDRKRTIEATKNKMLFNLKNLNINIDVMAVFDRRTNQGRFLYAYNKFLDNVLKMNVVSENNSDWLYYDEIFKDKYYDAFKKIEEEKRKQEEQEMNGFLREFYKFRKENAITNGTDGQSIELEKIKRFVLLVIRNLSKSGCLNELIKIENEKISEMNLFLPYEQTIQPITENEIINSIESLDVKKQIDVAKLYVYGRHFINKLAHNYDDLMFDDLLSNSTSEIFYRENREIEIGYISRDIYKILEIAAKKVREGNENSEEVNEFKNIMSKLIKPPKKFDKVADNYIGMYRSGKKTESEIIHMIEELIKNSQEQYKFTSYSVQSFSDYRYKCIEDLIKLKKDYYENSKNQKGNDRIALESFEGFFSRILDKTINKENYLDFETKDEKRNLIDEIEAFIQGVEDSNTLVNPKEVLRSIVHKMEVRDEIYAAKQFFTECLLEINSKKPGLIRLELGSDNANSKNAAGVFNVMLPRYTQIFGGHYMKEEFDSSDYKIGNLPIVNQSVAMLFGNGSYDPQSLSVMVPIMEELTDEQVDSFKKLIQTIDVIESGRTVTDDEKISYFAFDRLSKIKNESPKFYETLKVRFSLGAGLDVYENRYGIKPKFELNTVQKRLASFILSELDSGTTMEEILSSYGNVNEEIISYVIEKQKEKRFFANPTNEVLVELNRVENATLGKAEDKKEREE